MSTAPPPTLTATTFDVWLQPDPDTDPTHYAVMVRNGDQLRAELEANKLRLPELRKAPLHATSLWVWAACARLGYTEAHAQDFISTELVAYTPVKGQAVVPVDPTDQPYSSESG